MTAFRPDPQTLLTVTAATWSGSPPLSAACRAEFCPRPAETTLPMMHSSTILGSTPARRTASATTSAPSSGAVRLLSAPRNLPVGVRTALTMTESRTADLDALDHLRAKQFLEPSQDDGGGAHDFPRPLRARRLDDQQAPLELHVRGAVESRAYCRAPREADFSTGQRNVPQQLEQGARNDVSKGIHN